MIMSLLTSTAYADEVTDWNGHLLEAARVTNVNPLVAVRAAAIGHAAVCDAVNGIERRYAPIHVQPAADSGASRRAAAVQAAYATLIRLFPTEQIILDAKRQVSLDALAGDQADSHGGSITAGIAWGQKVAEAMWEWRSTDGFTAPAPPYLGGLNVGQWRPTPPESLPGVGVQFATMTTWVIPTPAYFRPTDPPALNSDQYAADFNEVKIMGSLSSTARSADQTLAAFYWNSTSSSYAWNTVAVSLAARRHTSLSENARLLALLNVTMADAMISSYDAKYTYKFWRPVTAIPLAADDGNPTTIEDSKWAPLLATPPVPEYPSGHSCASGAAAALLSAYFGEDTHFNVGSDVMLGVIRSFRSFSQALEEIKNARIFGGIHFRTACDAGQNVGRAVAAYVLHHVVSKEWLKTNFARFQPQRRA
jgi:membrane-associated phospholipid phosphatase